jgi:GT2 family glycosyltransferase
MVTERSEDKFKRTIGAVAIGRNEGERLRLCLSSLVREPSIIKVVYVDSNSSDGSVNLARQLGVEVVDLDLTQKFTAARARNAGWKRLIELHPEVEMIQFVDGDCEVRAGWLDAALTQLLKEKDVAVVCGRRRERFPEYSLYNQLCDLEWDTPIGEAEACGGDALILTEALLRVDGYREDLIAGEEPEMCYRMRHLGYRILRIDQEMTLHDANLSKPSQWFQRSKRTGHAFAEWAALHGAEAERMGVRQTMSNVFWGVAVPGALGVAGLSMGPLAASMGGAAAYAYLFNKSYKYESKRRTQLEARLMAAGCVAAKIPEALGTLQFLTNRALGKQSRLLEYK